MKRQWFDNKERRQQINAILCCFLPFYVIFSFYSISTELCFCSNARNVSCLVNKEVELKLAQVASGQSRIAVSKIEVFTVSWKLQKFRTFCFDQTSLEGAHQPKEVLLVKFLLCYQTNVTAKSNVGSKQSPEYIFHWDPNQSIPI